MDDSLKNRMAEVLDAGQVEELRSIPGEGGLDLFADVAGLFIRTTPELLEKMEKALQSGEREALAKLAHTLKGSASNLGAFHLSATSHRMEQSALKGESGLDALYNEISKDYESLQVLLEEIVESPSPLE